MSDDNPLAVDSIGSVHGEDVVIQNAAVISSEITTNHSDIPSVPLRREDGEEITASALGGASTQYAARMYDFENIPFAGGDGTHSILSVLFGAHSIGGGIFGFINMIDSNKIRVQCVECRKAVMDFPWMDKHSFIKGSIEAWRASFPCAQVVDLSNCEDEIVDADFVHIRGDARVRLHTVDMSDRRSDAGIYDLEYGRWGLTSKSFFSRVTDAAFVHLRGIHTLDMSYCNQETITDAAFVHLRGIHTLSMRFCIQETITDAAFVHLRGIKYLDMSGCNQRTITDAAFVHLRGIQTLLMEKCDQNTITDAAFVHLRGIRDLNMDFCNQNTITDAAFVNLRGIHTLNMNLCRQITAAAIENLRGIHDIGVCDCAEGVWDTVSAFFAESGRNYRGPT